MFILSENCRLLYKLGFIPNANPALSIKIREEILNSFKIDQAVVDEKVEQFGFQSFSGFDGDFGFNGAFQKKEEQGGFVEYIVPIPKITSIDGPPWKPVHAAVQSIALFTELARQVYGVNQPTRMEKKQLLALYVVADRKRDLYAVGGDYSSTICDWLDNIASRDNLDRVAKAMEQTYFYIWDRFRCGSFLAYLHEGGYLTIQCPSHCVVYPRSSRLKSGGVEFDSSEVCHGAEILVLLSGLSALYEMVGRDIYGSSY
ncbi:MAG: hypothetical protein WA092_01810 [Minisyncoccales bacterium]